MTSYPPEPWHLHARAVVAVHLVRDAPLPHAPGSRVLRVGPWSVVGVAFFSYEPPSPLVYEEVMSTVLVRDGLRPGVSITHIWVDSEASRDGGRALWGIPKDLATFDVAPGRHDAPGIASVSLGRRVRLPFALPLTFSVSQSWAGTRRRTPVRATARLGVASARWTVDPGGSLAFLTGFRPLLTLTLAGARVRFGRRPR
ncbi:acetoacetate decarboxylase family protein [Solicola sp. PLA-1-18]|uniref:acetoacetate decarboxylase family protein n=1 Tax=Solicola sp. PLA-1-18 TaxID=3380532 RepID=UPI003B78D46F